MALDLDAFDWPRSIRSINSLEKDLKERIYGTLIPGDILERFDVDFHDRQQLRINCPADTRSVEIIVFHEPAARDPVLYMQMADTLNYQIAILLLVVNDPESPRYNVDIDENGFPTRFGTLRRNIPEEIRALHAGLSPGQIRKGLRVTRFAISAFEDFLTKTGHELVIIEPLTYNNAIVYERYGFAYFQGRKRMEWIDSVLRPGGELFQRFDNSSPFRARANWATIRGRSWAIHDGILGEPFGDIRMFKQIGKHAGVSTFPDGIW